MVFQESKEEKPSGPDALTILLLGDPNVGKTSIIYSLLNDELDPNLPARLESVTLSAKVTPDHVPLTIVDYSERVHTNEDLGQLIEGADLICIVYSAVDKESFARVGNHWIPVIRRHQSNHAEKHKPIIVAANKIDLINDLIKPAFRPLFQEFEEVDAVIDVSALTQKNVVELFYIAQKAVLYPVEPVFDTKSRTLTKKCCSALINIFKLCDLDGDGLLSDHELHLFHENCFGIPLQDDTLDELKSIIKQSTMDGISDKSITQSGFLFLNNFSCDKGRHTFTWRVLRKYNYDNQINIINEPGKLTNERVNNISPVASPSSQDNNGQHVFKSDSDIVGNNIGFSSLLDLSRIRENSHLVRAGFGIAVATLISMLALKFIFLGGSRGSN